MIFGIIHFKIDTVLLSIFKPLADVGTYSVAYRFLEQVLFIPGFFVVAVFPIIASYHATGDAMLKVAIDKSFAFLVMLALPVAAASFVLAPDIIHLVAGVEFDAAVTPLRILVFASIFFFTNALFSLLLVIYELQRQMALLAATILVGNVALNLVLIPPFSYTGAAVATVITEACGGIAMMIWATRSVGARVDLSPLPRVLGATAGMVAVLWAALAFPLLVTVAAGLVAYAVLAYLLGVVSRSDLALLVPRAAR
jgi:O-antigen/teichoic acid export membrane protein